jgi:hypothetical protein
MRARKTQINKSISPKANLKVNSGIGVVSLATYTSPKIVEVRNQDWISYGEDNNYFGYLQDRINGSPTNNAIVNGISQMIFGRGLDATDSLLKPEDYAQAMLLLDDDTVERLCNDLKAMGQCAVQVVYSIDRSRILETNHFPVETLRSGKCDEDGQVNFYYYSDDWTKVTRSNLPTPIPAFDTSSESEEILYIKPYKTGFYYYSPVDYQGGLQYCELEEEISNYHLNNIMNGLAPSMLINFNNGTPTEDEQRQIERDIQLKFSGTSNAGRFILSFNDSNNYGATITPVQLSDAHNQYQFLSDESMRKIMVSHRVISPMLLGIKDNTGFGNNADELQTASVLMDNTVIRPFQNLLIKEFDKLLAKNNISLNLYFKTLQPLEFNDLSNAVTKSQIEQETGQKTLKSDIPTLDTELAKDILRNLKGERLFSDEWMLIDVCEANHNDKQLNAELNKVNLASSIPSTADESSVQDSALFKIRYSYVGSASPEREFCQKMMSNGLLYRYEDLDKDSSYNSDFAPSGESSYNIFMYKGGVNCKHWWMRKIYWKLTGDAISVNEARRRIKELLPNMKEEFQFPVNEIEVAQIADKENNFWSLQPNYRPNA